MRPNKIGWVIVAFFLAGGIVFTMTIPGIFIGQIWIAVSLLLAGIYLFMGRRADRLGSLRVNGVPGTATILEMTQTGVYVNNMPRVRLRLRVEPDGHDPYEIDKTMTVPHFALGALSAGRPLAVFIDPDDPDEMYIDWSGPGGGITVSQEGGAPVGVADPAAQQAVMQALAEHGIDPTTGSIDLRQLPAARAAVLEALRTHGIDAAHATAAADPATPVEDKGEPVDRLQKLTQLRAANLITQEEYLEHRKRVLDGI